MSALAAVPQNLCTDEVRPVASEFIKFIPGLIFENPVIGFTIEFKVNVALATIAITWPPTRNFIICCSLPTWSLTTAGAVEVDPYTGAFSGPTKIKPVPFQTLICSF